MISSPNETFGSTSAVPRLESILRMLLSAGGLLFNEDDDKSSASLLSLFANELVLTELRLPALLKGTCCSYRALSDLENCETAKSCLCSMFGYGIKPIVLESFFPFYF